jgi:hypothetical protein
MISGLHLISMLAKQLIMSSSVHNFVGGDVENAENLCSSFAISGVSCASVKQLHYVDRTDPFFPLPVIHGTPKLY